MLLTQKQMRRALFRYRHHYFSYLKYWSIYQEKFSYLDSKSQGLLSISSILTAVFSVFFTLDTPVGAVSASAKLMAVVGVVVLVIAQLSLLRCFSTTADRRINHHEGEAAILEGRVKSGGVDDLFGRSRVLEANFDKFLSLHLGMIQEVIDFGYAEKREALEAYWLLIRKSDGDSFQDFENSVSKFLGELRDAVEGEIEVRHLYYSRAKLMVVVAVFFLAACVGLLAYGMLQQGVFGPLWPE